MISPRRESRANEGLGIAYKLGMQASLLAMSRHRSIRYEATLREINEGVSRINRVLDEASQQPTFLSLEELQRIGAYKRKYAVYSAYFAAISSYPVLHNVAHTEGISEAVFAKLASIMSIKMLDNINDELHSGEEAVRSLTCQEKAFLEGDFEFSLSRDVVARAENVTYLIARLAHKVFEKWELRSKYTHRLLAADMHSYMVGQRESFFQKLDTTDGMSPQGLGEYLSKTCEKAIGKIWFDMDICAFEAAYGSMDSEALKMTSNIRRAMDLAHKSFQMYDDASDLREDLSHQIVNAVVLYAIDKGIISFDEAYAEMDSVMLKLEKARVFEDIMQLGDFIFFRALERIRMIENGQDKRIDLDALVFGLRILRAFAMRKWVFREKSRTSLSAFARSFYGCENVMKSIPDHILDYERFLKPEAS